MATEVDRERAHHYDTGRLEAFSDGVFAIAITLLIIEISVPHLENGESLGHALRGLWPSYFGYALSFITIGIMWANHHAMFKDIERTDHALLVLNILLLMCISFVPFTTAVVAEYMQDDDAAVTAMLAYGGTFTITALLFNAMWLWASRAGRLLDEHVSAARIRERTLRYLPGAPLYAAGMAIALVNSWAALAWWAALAAFFILPVHD